MTEITWKLLEDPGTLLNKNSSNVEKNPGSFFELFDYLKYY